MCPNDVMFFSSFIKKIIAEASRVVCIDSEENVKTCSGYQRGIRRIWHHAPEGKSWFFRGVN